MLLVLAPGAGAGAGGVACNVRGSIFGSSSQIAKLWALLQLTTMSCLRALSRQVAGAGADTVSWLCAWWKQGAGCRVPWLCTWWRQGAGAGGGRWLCAWWRQCARRRCRAPVLGAGCVRFRDRVPVLGAGACCGAGAGSCELAVCVVETRRRRWALAVRVVETAGAGAGAVSWQRAWWRLGAGAGCWLRAWWRQGAGCRVLVLGAGYTPVLGAGAGRRELACWCSVLARASDSEVITTAASDSEG